jgi:hypothetical protein
MSTQPSPYFFVHCIEHLPAAKHQLNQLAFASVNPIFSRHQVKFYDLLTTFDQENTQHPAADQLDYLINPYDAHPGPKSTEFCARQVRKLLEKEYADILGSQQTIKNHPLVINDWLPYELSPQLFNVTTNNDGTITATYTLTYPQYDNQDLLLTWPVGKPYVKLSFQFPIYLKTVIVSSESDDYPSPSPTPLSSVELSINHLAYHKSYLDQDGELVIYDDQTIYPPKSVQKISASTFSTHFDQEGVTSVNLSAKINHPTASPLTIQFIYSPSSP